MQFAGSRLAFVVQARERAKEIIWAPLEAFNQQFKLGLRFNENSGNVVFPNGSRILLFGAGNRREMEKLRGLKYPEIAIDEAQLFAGDSLRYLIEDVCEPAVGDYGAAGAITVTGTPNAACAGHMFNLWQADDGTVRHHWTLRENVYHGVAHLPWGSVSTLESREAYLADLRRRRGWTEQSATYLREYMGIWIRDASGLVYKLNFGLNCPNAPWDAFKALADDWSYTLGIDFGVSSPCAFTVVAHSLTLGRAFVVESWKLGGDGTPVPASRVAVEIEKLDAKYDLAAKMGDLGGLGKAFGETLMHDYGIVLTAAKKTEKAAHIETLNSDLQAGILTLCRPQCGELIEEMSVLQWSEADREKGVHKEQRGQANHCADSALYAWRGGVHKDLSDWEQNPPASGSAEAIAAAEERAFERHAARFRRDQEDDPQFHAGYGRLLELED